MTILRSRNIPIILSTAGLALSPFWFVTVFGINVGPVDFLLLGAAGWIIFSREWELEIPPVPLMAGFAFLIVAAISLLVTPRPLEGLLDWLQYFWLFAGVIPIVTTVFRDRSDQQRALTIFATVLTLIAVVVTVKTVIEGNQESWWYGNFNQTYWLTAIAAILITGFSIDSRQAWRRWSVMLLSGIFALRVLMSPSESAALLLVVGWGVLIAVIFNRKGLTELSATGLFGIMGIAYWVIAISMAWPRLWQSIPGMETRLPMYGLAFSKGMDAFPVGTGLSSSAVVLDSLPAGIARSVHNFILHYWMETGVFGLGAILVLFGAWIRQCLLSTVLQETSARAALPMAIFAGYIAVIFFQPPPVRRMWWFLFAMGYAQVNSNNV